MIVYYNHTNWTVHDPTLSLGEKWRPFIFCHMVHDVEDQIGEKEGCKMIKGIRGTYFYDLNEPNHAKTPLNTNFYEPRLRFEQNYLIRA